MKKNIKYFVIFVLLVLVVVLTVGYIIGNKTLNPLYQNCNGTGYVPITQSCCFGKVLDGQWLEFQYDKECENLNQLREWNCEGVNYNRNISHCCNGKVIAGGGWWERCGNSCYNETTQSCCKGIIYEGINRCCNIDNIRFVQPQGQEGLLCPERMECCKTTRNGDQCFDPSMYKCEWQSRPFF